MAVRLPILGKGTPGMDVDFEITGTGVTSGTTTEYTVTLGSVVQFTDLSTNSPTEWLWDFGDGTTSRLQNPTKIYTALSAGRTVSLLTGKDGSGGYEEKTNVLDVTTSTVLLLDTYSANAEFGFSLRKLSAGYAGNCLRVRRASDDTESDIGFDGGLIDIAAIQSFCSGTDGYVSIWYNQAPTANGNLEQTDVWKPKIVSSGTIITNNFGKPAIQFVNSPVPTGLNNTTYTIGNVWLMASAFSCSSDNQRMIQSNTTNSLISNRRSDGNNVFNEGGFYSSLWGANDVAQVTSLSKNTDYMILKYNNTILNQGTLNTANWGTLAIGRSLSNGEPPTGKFSELVIWSSPLLADQDDINDDLMLFWL